MKPIIFPENFLWGASTSSHQVEGGAHNDWSEWERQHAARLVKEAQASGQPWQQEKFPEMKTPENYISGNACGHYERYREDFALARSLGHNAHRLSLEWSRIEPKKGEFNRKALLHYQDVVQSLQEQGITPFVTLWHWPLPLWLQKEGGWRSPKTPLYFARYADEVCRTLPEVRFWITINEPHVYASRSYFKGSWPPQKKSFVAYAAVLRNLAEAHKRAFVAIKKLQPEAQIGIAKNNIHFEAYQQRPLNVLLKKTADWWWNFSFLQRIRDYQDFIGLNHYFHNHIDGWFGRNANAAVSDLGWELYPESIYAVLMDLRRYGKPIYVTENGLADAADTRRPRFLVDSLGYVGRAIADGADVRGYLHWSLMDNFEWDKGFWPRFGLVEIDYNTLERKPRHSAALFKDIIADGGVTEGVLSRHQQCCLWPGK